MARKQAFWKMPKFVAPVASSPLLALPIPVIQSASRTPLVTAVCATPLLEPCFVPAGGTAIALPTIAVPKIQNSLPP
jgi:hypothetical protein